MIKTFLQIFLWNQLATLPLKIILHLSPTYRQDCSLCLHWACTVSENRIRSALLQKKPGTALCALPLYLLTHEHLPSTAGASWFPAASEESTVQEGWLHCVKASGFTLILETIEHSSCGKWCMEIGENISHTVSLLFS